MLGISRGQSLVTIEINKLESMLGYLNISNPEDVNTQKWYEITYNFPKSSKSLKESWKEANDKFETESIHKYMDLYEISEPWRETIGRHFNLDYLHNHWQQFM
jgi:hypothetical protein